MAALALPPNFCEVPVTSRPCSEPRAHLKDVNGHPAMNTPEVRVPGSSEHPLPSPVSEQQARAWGTQALAPNLLMPLSRMLIAQTSGPTSTQLRGKVPTGRQLGSWPLARCWGWFINPVQENQVRRNVPAWPPHEPLSSPTWKCGQ